MACDEGAWHLISIQLDRDSEMIKSHRRRLLIGRFFHESNGFNPHKTTRLDFNISAGSELVGSAIGTGTTLAGIIAGAENFGWEIVPALSIIAPSSGLIDAQAYRELKSEFIDLVAERQFDAIALDLHGAMGSEDVDDCEGDFLTALRQEVGSTIPIGVGLDMHAHITAKMLQAADICIACKECPHTDFAETGRRVIMLLNGVLDRAIKPVVAMARAPMINLDSGLTKEGPLGEIKRRAERIAAADPGILDISLCSVFRLADFSDPKGQVALVLSNGHHVEAEQIAKSLADERSKSVV